MTLALIVIFGAFLRFYNNTAVALWHDEAFSALFMRYPFDEMIYRIGLDVHPPLYYLILRVWTFFAGESLLALRLLSIVFGILTVFMGYHFVKAALQNRRLALLAAFLLAINPFQIQYSLEARMYTLGTFLVLWSSYFLVSALNSIQENRRTLNYWLAYGLTAAAGIYTHYYVFFSIAAQGIFILLFAIRRRNLKALLGAALAYFFAVLLYAPWLKVFLYQLKQVQASYWIPPLNRWSVPETVWKMFFGGPGAGHLAIGLAAAVALIILGFFLKKNRNFAKWLVFLSLIIPFASAVALSILTNLYLDRYFVFSGVFFLIALAGALSNVPKFIYRNLLVAGLTASMIYAFFQNWRELGIKGKPGMAGAASYLNQNVKPNDKILVGSSFIFFTFKYYNQTPAKPLLISSEPVEKIPHFSGTAILTNDDLTLNYRNVPKGSTVWLLWTTGFGSSKPETAKNWRQISEKEFPDAPGFKGSIFAAKYLAE